MVILSIPRNSSEMVKFCNSARNSTACGKLWVQMNELQTTYTWGLMSVDKATEPSDGFSKLLCSSKLHTCECPLDCLLLTFAAAVLFITAGEEFESVTESVDELCWLCSIISQPSWEDLCHTAAGLELAGRSSSERCLRNDWLHLEYDNALKTKPTHATCMQAMPRYLMLKLSSNITRSLDDVVASQPRIKRAAASSSINASNYSWVLQTPWETS